MLLLIQHCDNRGHALIDIELSECLIWYIDTASVSIKLSHSLNYITRKKDLIVRYLAVNDDALSAVTDTFHYVWQLFVNNDVVVFVFVDIYLTAFGVSIVYGSSYNLVNRYANQFVISASV